MPSSPKKRVLIFIVAYHAETTIADVLRRIPATLNDAYEVDILIIDDSSRDLTFAKSHETAREAGIPFDIRILFNPVNQGYGGNQKLGYRYAIDRGYDYVALLHGDGQYAPECLPDLLGAFEEGDPAAVFGSRMLTKNGARGGGMPLYKFVGNKILTWTQNRLLRSHLSEFHSGYRIYSVDALRNIPFERNSNDFHFDTEIIIQLMFFAKRQIRELPIPTYYGDEICRVNGIAYAFNVVLSTFKARMQELGIFYDRRYDCAAVALEHYTPKFDYPSTHTFAFNLVPPHSRVLDLGCAGGYMAAELKRRKGCYAVGVDAFPLGNVDIDEFYLRDLNEGLAGLPVAEQDLILMLDVIEHLASPERFLDDLRETLSRNPRMQIIISTANIGFIIPRLMLLLGQFNYGKRGILDMTHTRLFTFSSFRRLLEQCGFDILEMRAVPGPFPLALGDTWLSRLLLGINQGLMKISRGMFGYQIFARIKARPTVSYLLDAAHAESDRKVRALESVS
ncbi:MAG TPA: bifunctional glycosyltransferase/class I SAM-dependent methyltransferase [Bryobacteraceae bacterium]|nr:bifunctional glycosyltransferase/class I SAM-dependent methyltransferase [Bryobacteraceae bacterium]